MPNNTIQRPTHEPQAMERTLRIEGERSSAFFGTAIRVARVDSRLRELAGVQTADGRKAYRQACEGYTQAIGMFEDSLSTIERDLEMNNRRAREAQRKKGDGNRPARHPQTAKPANAQVAQPGASNVQHRHPTKPAGQSQPKPGDPKPQGNGQSQRQNQKPQAVNQPQKQPQKQPQGQKQGQKQEQRKEQKPAATTPETPIPEQAATTPVPAAALAEAKPPRADSQKPAAAPRETTPALEPAVL